MKKYFVLCVVMLIALALVSCNGNGVSTSTEIATDALPESTGETEVPFAGSYRLEFVPNGEKTCTVNLIVNPDGIEPLDVVIPPTSPEGDHVTATGSIINSWDHITPLVMTVDFFEEQILHPLEEYYGITREQWEEIRGDHGHPLYAAGFYLGKHLAYFISVSRDKISDDERWAEILAEYPLGEHMAFYALDNTVSETELERLDETLSAATTLTLEQTWQEHAKMNAYLKQYELDVRPYPTMARSIRSLTLESGFSSLPTLGWGRQYEVILPDTLTGIEADALRGFSGLTSIVIPARVTSIGEGAFAECENLKAVTIPNGVTGIGASAFADCTSLSSITIPDSVTSIGSSAFADCTSLSSISIPDSVTSIGYSAFNGCTSLESMTLPFVGGAKDDETNHSFGYIFGGEMNQYVPESLKSVVIIGGEKILDDAFKSCSMIESITIPDTVSSIGAYAFSGCTGLSNFAMPDGLTSIGMGAFFECAGMKNLTIPDGVTSIGGYAFAQCQNLVSITIPDGVPSLDEAVFRVCNSLTSITLPDSVTSIGKSAFSSCTGLTSITYQGTIAEWQAIPKGERWDSSTATYTIHCTDGTIAKDGTVTPNA